MRNAVLATLALAATLLAAVACVGSESAPTADEGVAQVRDTPVPVAVSTPTATPTAEGVSEAKAAGSPDAVPAGSLALFYGTRLGTNTQSLRGYNITWEEGQIGVLRYVPEDGRVDLMKRATSPSYSKSALYALTVGGRLFVIRDWGADWTSDNKRFGIEELDPHTGKSLSTTNVTAEWFAIHDDRVFFKRRVNKDLWGNYRGGGELAVKKLGSTAESELLDKAPRFQSVGDQLVWMKGSNLRCLDIERS